MPCPGFGRAGSADARHLLPISYLLRELTIDGYGVLRMVDLGVNGLKLLRHVFKRVAQSKEHVFTLDSLRGEFMARYRDIDTHTVGLARGLLLWIEMDADPTGNDL